MQMTPINFQYSPKTLTTAECIIKVRTSEFDSQDKVIRIVGNATPVTGLTKMIQIEQPVIEEEPRPKTLLHSRQKTAGVKLEKLGQSEGSQLKTLGATTDEQNSSILNLKNIKLTPDEQQFIKEYRRLEELEREKGIKFF